MELCNNKWRMNEKLSLLMISVLSSSIGLKVYAIFNKRNLKKKRVCKCEIACLLG